MDFLLVLFELLSLDVTAEAIVLQRGPDDPKYQVQGVASPTIFFRKVG